MIISVLVIAVSRRPTSHLPTNYFDPHSRTSDNSRMQRDWSARIPTSLVACREELQVNIATGSVSVADGGRPCSSLVAG